MEEEKKHHPFKMPSVVSNSVPLSGSRSGPSLSSFEPKLQLAALLLFFSCQKEVKRQKQMQRSCWPRLTPHCHPAPRA